MSAVKPINITTDISAIETAARGEEVRDTITAALEEIQDAVQYQTEPVQNSNDAFTAGGAYNALAGKAGTIAGVYYGVCDTEDTTQVKTVTIAGITALSVGLNIRVKFTNGQGFNGAVALNLNSLGAKSIARYGAQSVSRYEWSSGEVLDLVYDGTNWIVVNESHATTTYYGVTKLSSSYTSTSTDMAATPSAVKAAYDLADSKQDAINAGTISLSTTWSGSDPYTQTVTVTGVTTTANSEVSLRPTVAQLANLLADGITALLVENNAGTLTVYALGASPSTAMTIAVTVTEVTT